MLVPDLIPSKEPLIRVGIILPEDKLGSVIIDFNDQENYTVSAPITDIGTSKLEIVATGNQLSIGDKSSESITIKCSKSADIDRTLVVHDVIAGREFHWKKAIAVNLTGDLELRSLDGRILLINELPIEPYLMCVATSEMSAECPPALIEAQTIVARAWMLANVEQKHRHLGFDVCNDDCCQRYHGTAYLTPQAIAGATSSRGQVLMHADKICDARYSKSCGGMMEQFEILWDGPPLPYMQNKFDAPDKFRWEGLPLSEDNNLRQWVESQPHSFCSPHFVPENDLIKYIGSVDDAGEYFRWEFEYSQLELTELLNSKLDIHADKIVNIIPKNRGGSGRINKLQIDYFDSLGEQQQVMIESEYRIRQVLHPSFLYSSAFYIKMSENIDNLPGKFILRGAGWGHGAGLCQIGALGMALAGFQTSDILDHYYPGSRLVTIYD